MFVATTLATMQTRADEPALPIKNPCTTDYNQNCYTEWEGPKYDTIIGNSLGIFQFDCGPNLNCVFRIQYYDRICRCPPSNLPDKYDAQIVMVAAEDGCFDCYETNKDKIYKEFYRRRMNEVKSIFLQRYPPPICLQNFHLVTKGQCVSYDQDSVKSTCGDVTCCAYWIKVCFDANGELIPDSIIIESKSLYLSGNDTPRRCEMVPYNCPTYNVECDHNLFVGHDQLRCDFPCNGTNWTVSSKEFYLENPPFNCGMTPCKIKVFYKFRKSIDCDPAYYDYKIDSIQIDESCFINYQGLTTLNVYKYTVKWLLKNGENGVPENNEDCIDTYRVLNATCWKLDSMQVDTILKYVYLPCGTQACCITQYRVCKGFYGDTIIFKLSRLDSTEQTCINTSHPLICYYICDDTPISMFTVVEQLYDSEKLFIMPNPAKENIQVSWKNKTTGQYTVDMYDSKGILILRRKINKSTELLQFYIETDEFYNGIYFINLSFEGSLVVSEKFKIFK